MESYATFSSDYLRYNTAQYSPEDLEALHAELNDDDDMDDQVGGETSDEQYEIMLRLGAAITLENGIGAAHFCASYV